MAGITGRELFDCGKCGQASNAMVHDINPDLIECHSCGAIWRRDTLTIDAWGVGFSARKGRLLVHFPHRNDGGETIHGPGIPVDAEPEIARNGIRAALFRELLGR